jgi:uncharacterized protein YbjT (DUF2867 family)
MAKALHLVTGASGHIGTVIAKTLLDAGEKVRVVGRDAAKLKAFADRGAEVEAGALEDHAFTKKAYAGATTAFVMVPPNYAHPDQRAHARAVIDGVMAALPGSGVTHVVALSSIGAHLRTGTGPIAGLHELEARLSGLPLAVLNLRPAYFFENHFAALGTIPGMGIYGGAVRADLPLAMIATGDIGAVAAKRLAAQDFVGNDVLELHGPAAYTMAEAAATLGAAIGKPGLPYVQFPIEGARQAMTGMGMSPDGAGRLLEMITAFNDGTIQPTQPRSPATTTPTTLAQWAGRDFAGAFNAGAKKAH